MSEYTTQIRYLIESNFDFGLKDYPIFDETHRTELNAKILEHYKFREIGLETPALFKAFLNRKMKEIMPYYNQLYKSEATEFNPLFNVDLTETYTHTTTDTGNSTENSTNTNSSESTGVTSDTPQSSISDDDIKNNVYATNIEHDKGTETNGTTATGTNANTREETFSRHELGSSAMFTFSQNIKQWREIMLNIDMQVIEELEPLFIQLW